MLRLSLYRQDIDAPRPLASAFFIRPHAPSRRRQ